MTKQKTNSLFLIVAVFIVLAVFLRVYKFEEYLHFKWDQARDLVVTSEAIEEGPSQLPLYGPRAVKMEVDGEREQLRLGPGYFYFQYLFSLITGSQQPHVFAYFELIASLLSLGMLYLFSRLFFSKFYSFVSTILYAFSLMAIQFSRFAWNPNALPLFALTCYYSVIKFFRVKTFKERLLYFGLWSVSFAIAGQLHYMGLFLISSISGLYFVYKVIERRKEVIFKKDLLLKKTKRLFIYLGVFLVIFSFFNIPLILGEIAYKAENTRNFIPAFAEKSEDDDLKGKVIKNFKIHGEHYSTILTGVYFEKEMLSFNVFYFGFAIVLLPIIFLVFAYFKTKNKERELVVFLLIALVGYFILTIPIAFKHYIRYFLVVIPLPFVFVIFFSKFLMDNIKNKYIWLVWLIPIFIFSINSYKTFKWFSDLKIAQADNSPYYKENSPIKNRGKDDVTLGQLQRAVDYIYNERGNDELLTFSCLTDYKISFEYLFYLKDKNLFYDFDGGSNNVIPYSEYYFFISTKRKKEAEIPEIFLARGDLTKAVVKGQLIIYKFKLKEPFGDDEINNFINEEKKVSKKPDHYKITIKDFFTDNYFKYD
jgi:hypothetical protein